MSDRKQWYVVVGILGCLGAGGVFLALTGPDASGVAVGHHAPGFSAVDRHTGDSISLAHYRGHVTLLNIWRTDCVPCRTEMPAMQHLFEKFGPRGFRVAAISVDLGNEDEVRQFADARGLSFDILQDQTPAVQDAYETTGVPESFLLDRDGVILKRVIGAYPWDAPASLALVERLMDQTQGTDVR